MSKIWEQINDSNWCQGHYHKKADGSFCEDPTLAAAHCLYGWLGITYPDFQGSVNKICKILNTNSLVVWNDAPERTWQDVKGVFKAADL